MPFGVHVSCDPVKFPVVKVECWTVMGNVGLVSWVLLR